VETTYEGTKKKEKGGAGGRTEIFVGGFEENSVTHRIQNVTWEALFRGKGGRGEAVDLTQMSKKTLKRMKTKKEKSGSMTRWGVLGHFKKQYKR